MIRSFIHKGLMQFFETGTKKGIQPEQAPKLARILDRLDASTSPKDMNLPGFALHQLHGQEEGTWAVSVNGNWRITFSFKGNDAFDVDYRDYH
jgi:proteic killer suppression protein